MHYSYLLLLSWCVALPPQALFHPRQRGNTNSKGWYGPFLIMHPRQGRKTKPATISPKFARRANGPSLVFRRASLIDDNVTAFIACTIQCNMLIHTQRVTTFGNDSLLHRIIPPPPPRPGSIPAPVLARIWTFCLGVVDLYKCQWHVIISKMGVMSDFEDSCEYYYLLIWYIYLLV